ncbi:MAG: N-6 DNA methylase [Pseudomonadota bacterium]
MNQFKPHNIILIRFYESIIDSIDHEKIKSLIDLDHADTLLRDILSVEEMRTIGSFFTGQALTTKAVDQFKTPITEKSVVLDPTCGTGNLLIESSRRLPIYPSLLETLRSWGKVLRGYDIHEVFVEATKLRLMLEALSRGTIKDCSINDAFQCFPNIKTADAMCIESHELANVTHALMNPPFSSWDSPEENYWNPGKTNAAGIVFDFYLRNLPNSCEVSAILPDVLRSGSRYEKWRNFVSQKLGGSIIIIGRFNSKTNIDVFLIQGFVEKENNKSISWFPEKTGTSHLSDYFEVCIGPLVSYRDPQDGPLAPYVHSNNTPPWETISSFKEYRRFKGRLILPPFVVVRRTSSPTNKFRASGAIIDGTSPVAVENHLVVIKPKSREISDCQRLLEQLKSQDTNDFINRRIRCRHLTVGVIKDISIW